VAGRLATVAVPGSLVALVAWASGGYFPRTWGAVLLVEAIVIAAAALLSDRIEPDRRAFALIGSLVGLAAWQAMSGSWSVAPDAAPLEAERTLVYAGAAAAAFLTVPRRRAGDLLLGVLGGAAVATTGGLLEHVVAAGVPNGRLEPPVGYANATGILATTTILLGLGLAATEPRWRAALGAGVAVPATAALYLSLSRGSLVVAALGLVVLLATSRSTGVGRILLAGIPCAAALVVVRVGSFGDPDFSGGEAASLLVLGVVAVAAAAVLLRPPAIRLPRPPRTAVVAVAALAAVGIVLVGVREVREVRAAPALQQGAPDRLLSTSTSSRGDYWGVALAMVGREPLLGEGAGSYERAWIRERPALLYAKDAHNGFLETLAELGPVGLALLVAALGIPLLAVRGAVGDATGRAALAAYVAVVLHVVLDWDLEIPAVTLCTVLLGVVLVRLAGSGASAELRGVARAAILASAAAIAVVATIAHAGNGALADAHEALDRGDAVAAHRAAERARRFMPWSAEPWRLLGEAELAAGRLSPARDRLRRAAAEDPGSRQTWLALAFATHGDERARALARVRALDPLSPELDALEPSNG
jgi:hypothetical protein